ncbi:MAG: toll/interleukin-1 receptor domain-containing protein [Bacteroides sp.]|nr:toll/interleukin-1 receptor domain-containing protein [Bacteroides sp.]
MNKPTLFFSHSSKDKDMVLAIKNKVMKYTSGTLEIFQSSDGESIPFGTNWIHKVEEGLKEAKVMFVFVTEKSISSGWIYFEAGFAYSKGVHVIPVGLGVSVGDLKAPLNLLQGFNITSAESLNNFLTIVNREFSYSFPAQFTDDDYNEIITLSSATVKHSTPFDEVIRSVKFTLRGVYYEDPGQKKTRDAKAMFDRVVEYLDAHGIAYSINKINGFGSDKGDALAVQGMKIVYEIASQDNDSGTISVSISPYNFEKSYALFLQLAVSCFDSFATWIQLQLNNNYKYVTAAEDCAALLLEAPEWFSLATNRVGSFDCDRLQLRLSLVKLGPLEYALRIHYNPAEIATGSIVELVSRLCELKMIYKSGGANNA